VACAACESTNALLTFNDQQNEKLIRNRKDFIRVEGQKKDGVKFRNPDLHR
jgi:hypothetical protein